MTTDTFPKGATATAIIEGTTVRINGFCKGSGMIAPDMATMLGYLFTDAALPATVLQPLLKEAADKSFNCVTVDGDTSTSDTVLLCATGQAKNAAITNARDPRLADFRRALAAVSIDLAQQLARDGEGAEKFVTIEVTGAENDRAARRIGLSIGNSPLVKTAIAAADANWGRIVMAVGKAGEKAERDRLSISVGGIQIAAEGGPVPGYREGPVSEHMKGREIMATSTSMAVTGAEAAKPIVLVTAVALIDADSRVLLAQRPEGKPMAGLWEFPGGKVHDGETPERALIRELEEELGIDVEASCLAPFTFASHGYSDFHLLMPLYVCRKWSGIVTAREGQQLKWVRPARLGDYPMPPADKPLVAMLRDLL